MSKKRLMPKEVFKLTGKKVKIVDANEGSFTIKVKGKTIKLTPCVARSIDGVTTWKFLMYEKTSKRSSAQGCDHEQSGY